MVREKTRECHNHKPQPFPDTKRKRKPTNPNKNKRTKSTKISSIFPKRGNRNTKRTEKHKNKKTCGKTHNKPPRRTNHKATKSKTNTGTTALERSVEQTIAGFKALLQLANFTLGPDATLNTETHKNSVRIKAPVKPFLSFIDVIPIYPYLSVSKFNVGLKSLLQQGLSEPEFYGDLVYKLRKIYACNDFSTQFRKIILRYKKIGYNINVIRQTACMVINPITGNTFASLFNCTPAGLASDSIMVPA